MQNTPYTPGPWIADYDETLVDKDQLHSVKADGFYIVSLFKSGTSPEDEHSEEAEHEVRANAQLVSAAPDLVELAFQYRSDLLYPVGPGSLERRIQAIDAVLSKAGVK